MQKYSATKQEELTAYLGLKTDEKRLIFLQNQLKRPSPFKELSWSILFYEMILLDQDKHLFDKTIDPQDKRVGDLFEKLQKVDEFYRSIGGLVGYHCCFLEELEKKNRLEGIEMDVPDSIDVSKEKDKKAALSKEGLFALNRYAEMYPAGGAGERLCFVDPKTNEPMPVALYPFMGRELLSHMIEDVKAAEALYKKVFGKELDVPICLMTSDVSGNHDKILTYLKEKNFFGKSKEQFLLFKQPLVPVILEDGTWHALRPYELTFKPGGHGLLWKSALEQGVFGKLLSLGIQYLGIRQINNPFAALSGNMLALLGAGVESEASFGFFCCKRAEGASEGTLVQSKKKKDGKTLSTISNIEYTELKSLDVEQKALLERCPANTNILFAKIEDVINNILLDPIPGRVLNLKTVYKHPLDGSHVHGGRLESMMQSLSDTFFSEKKRVFALKEERERLVSVTKKALAKDAIEETPEGAFLAMQKRNRELLLSCGMKVPPPPKEAEFLQKGLNFWIALSPHLGPLDTIIRSKIQGGSFHDRSSLEIEAGEVSIEDLHLEGSLKVLCKGAKDLPRLRMKNVFVKNKGLKKEDVLKTDYESLESVTILLEGSSEFEAEDVTIEGNFSMTVPDGFKAIARKKEKGFLILLEKIDSPSWSWNYFFDENNELCVKKKKR